MSASLGRCVALWDAADAVDPLPSLNDVSQAIGIEVACSEPGDLFAEDVDLVMYWPRVRPEWEGTT